MLKNDICITANDKAILELWGFRDEQVNPQASRKMSFSGFSNSSIMPKMTSLLITNSLGNAVCPYFP